MSLYIAARQVYDGSKAVATACLCVCACVCDTMDGDVWRGANGRGYELAKENEAQMDGGGRMTNWAKKMGRQRRRIYGNNEDEFSRSAGRGNQRKRMGEWMTTTTGAQKRIDWAVRQKQRLGSCCCRTHWRRRHHRRRRKKKDRFTNRKREIE